MYKTLIMDHELSSQERKDNSLNLKDFTCGDIIVGGNNTFENLKNMLSLCLNDNKGLLLLENDVISFDKDIVKKSIEKYNDSVVNFSFPIYGHIKGYLYLYNQLVYFPLEICKELVNKMDNWISLYPYYYRRNEHDIYISRVIKDFYSIDANIKIANFKSELNHDVDSKEYQKTRILSKKLCDIFI